MDNSNPGLPAGKKIREEGTDGRIRSGPFIWQRCSQQSTVRLSRRRRILLFCLQGSVTLNFHSFSYTLTPGSVATVDGRLLCECWCTGVTELMEYLPRDRRFHVYESGDNRSAFTVLSVQGRLSDWAAAIALRIRAGAPLSCYSFCSVAVQLRDCSRGQIPYPFSCAPGCPVWKRCAGTAACMEMQIHAGKAAEHGNGDRDRTDHLYTGYYCGYWPVGRFATLRNDNKDIGRTWINAVGEVNLENVNTP